MHNEHKTLKWCAVILAAIIAIAAIAAVAIQTIPVFDTWEEEKDTVQLNEKTAAIVEQQGLEVAEGAASADQTAQKQSESDGQTAKAQSESTDQAVSNTGGAELEGQASSDKSAAKPLQVTVKVDGLEMDLMTASTTVGDMLENYGIPVGPDDIVTPAADQMLTADSSITIERITFEEIVVSEEIPFKVKVKGTDELPAKTQKVVQKGQKGEDKVTYRIKYSDGVEVARKEIARETVKKPVKKIILKSTVGTINGQEYARKFTVKAYSYTGGGTTASGLPAAVGRIAVDPRVIPLGTRVYVEGYGFATAADTGGNIKGNTIDVYYNSESQCRQWGCRYITIYILK